ncbi:outer membrane beta-barrel protein [Shewanella salipaludis]|uniref:Outer membrane beta-barrel protein n=1 Tax=Shewanella salipaludis TaxID=2723052 RepID=A0A972G0P6_9GAMM|nr:outer membrane beta-barrel protein [Shewanella salipaludis]NMH65371.1 outer membrane beta-barrel protein [Shewanella salipaludis]
MNQGIKLCILALSSGCTLLAGQVAAQDGQQGAITTASGIDLIPGLNSKLKHDDNIASSSANEEESWVLEVTPALRAQLLRGADQYSLDVAVAAGRYFSSSDDDYVDFRLGGDAAVELNQSNRFNLNALWLKGHEDRGTGVSEGAGNAQDEPNKFTSYDLGGYYEYGAMTTPARIRLNAKLHDKDYTNFEAVTRYKDYASYALGTAFYYDTRANTSLVAEVSQENISYDEIDPSGDRDNSSRDYKLGVDWQATAATAGSFRIGYQQKDFDNQAREDFGGLAWLLSVTWQPLTYSTLQLNSGRKAKDPSTDGDYIRETSYGINWTHEWSPIWSTDAGFSRMKEAYTGIDRDDTLDSFNLSVTYAAARWLTMKAGVDISDKSSTVENIKFDKNVFYLSANMTL